MCSQASRTMPWYTLDLIQENPSATRSVRMETGGGVRNFFSWGSRTLLHRGILIPLWSVRYVHVSDVRGGYGENRHSHATES